MFILQDEFFRVCNESTNIHVFHINYRKKTTALN